MGRHFYLLTFFLLIAVPLPGLSAGLSKSLWTDGGGVASAHPAASRAGVQILKAGGNAADAATAVALALAVVYPQAGNLGGGGFLVYADTTGSPYVLDFRETAPAAAHKHMYENQPPEASTLGGLAVGVPGTVKGFYHFQQKFGKLPWPKVVEPAIRLAEGGFEVNRFLEERLALYAEQLKKFPSTARIFFPGGKNLKAGDRLVQKDLARTLRVLALHGEKPFYSGEIAREIAKSVQLNGGVLTFEDLKNYRVKERRALEINYRGYSIYTVPPPSSGGVVLSGIFQALTDYTHRPLPWASPERIHLLAELEKHYFYLRNRWLGDPDFVQFPLQKLVSPELAKTVLRKIRPQTAGNPIDYQWMDGFVESEETTHFSVVDGEGRLVSVTYTLNGNFGCKLVAGNTGILLNNEMDDFAILPGRPNQFGLVQGEANTIAPGKRMLSSMTPCLVQKNGAWVGAVGSPGGPTIITTVLQVLLNKIDYEMTLPEALKAGRFHAQGIPDSIKIERQRFPEETVKKLEQWGHRFVEEDYIGDVHAIWRSGEGWEICSDPRGIGYPAVVKRRFENVQK